MALSQLLLLLGVLVALLLGFEARRRAGRLTEQAGLPVGRLQAGDTGRWRRGPLLRSRRHRLAGRPDYILRASGSVVPVEVKSGRAASAPYANDVLQLAAYCLLLSEEQGQRVPYGLLRYANVTFTVPFTLTLEQELLETLGAMRANVRTIPDRSHEVPARCQRCGLSERCGQALGT